MSGTTEVVGTEGPGLVAVNSVRIAYTSTGSVGAPLVLVHGASGGVGTGAVQFVDRCPGVHTGDRATTGTR